jgi:hypothetical protein
VAENRVGGDVDAYCTKCKMVLGHTILAMVGKRIARVRCNTCQGEHAYKAGPPGTKAPRARTGSSATREKAEVRPFSELFAGKDVAAARRYSAKELFEAGDVIAHPTFGTGLVQAARGDKIDVVFESGEKKLVHGLASGSKPLVEFDKPGRRITEDAPAVPAAGGAADKPPPGGSTGIHVVHAHPLTELPPRPAPAGEEPPAEDAAEPR